MCKSFSNQIFSPYFDFSKTALLILGKPNIALEIPQLWTTLNYVREYPNAVLWSWNHLNCY